MDKYDITTAARRLEEFINDLSVWYLRRSRERFKSGDEKAIKVLGCVLIELAKLLAPFIPFTADYIYKEIGGHNESIHLEDWPKTEKKLIDEKLEQEMERVRQICSMALQVRAEKGIKVRQPLNKLKVKSSTFAKASADKRQLEVEFADLIKDEINVKEIIFGAKIENEVELDTKLTPELKEEGIVRDFIREIQAKRKEIGLTPKDKIKVYYSENKEVMEKHKEQIKKQVIAEEIKFGEEFKIEKI